jgi:pimeloyl-ACP methyl ester carboxylesterase
MNFDPSGPDSPGNSPDQPNPRQAVTSEYIRIPSAAKAAGTPEVLNQASFLRVRHPANDPAQLDAVLIYIPGSCSGCTSSALPAQIVEAARQRGLAVEVWTVDRRESLLEDHAGFRQALLDHDPTPALRYYYGSQALDAQGNLKPGARPGGQDAQYSQLKQEDVPFMAEWGIDAAAADLEAMLNLVPEQKQAGNVFLIGHAQGGLFTQIFAGIKLSDRKRAFQRLAGLVFIDSGPIPEPLANQPSWFAINTYLSEVIKMREGKVLRFEEYPSGELGRPDTCIPLRIMAMLAAWQPEAESSFPLRSGQAAGGAQADEFRRHLRLSNLARFAFTFDDDPLPGAFLGSYAASSSGMRLGRLDFTPLPGSEKDCAAPGPNGRRAPCIPAPSQIDPTRIYQWIDGGPGSPLPGIYNGWTKVPERPSLTIKGMFASLISLVVLKIQSTQKPGFTGHFVHAAAQPSRATVLAELYAFGTTLSNAVPLTIDFPASGRLTIDSGYPDATLWYINRRYSADIVIGSLFKKVLIKRDGVFLDIDKRAVNIPILAYSLELLGKVHDNPFPKVKDFTRIAGSSGVYQTPLARELSPIDTSISMPGYLQGDFCTADNSLAGQVKPGRPGAAVVPNTLIDWLIPRIKGGKFALAPIATHSQEIPPSS